MGMQNGTKSTYGHRRTVEIGTTGLTTSDTYVFGIQKTRETISNFSSVSNGNFRTPNPHAYVVSFKEYWHGTLRSLYPNGRTKRIIEGLQSRTLVDNLPSAFAFSDTAYNRALSEVAEAVRGTTDMSVDLVQWRQVAQMINIRKKLINKMATTVNTMTGRLNEFERISRARVRRIQNRGRNRDIRMDHHNRWYERNARNLADELASRRLEFVYGWAPLAGTIVGLGEEFTDLDKPWNRWMEVRARGYERSDYTVTVGTQKRIHKVTYRCQIDLKLLPPENVLLSQASRISSLNPISLAYEVIPFSFVVDWFVDIGGWIRETETSFVNSARFASGFITEGIRGHCKLEDIGEDSSSVRDLKGSVLDRHFRRRRLNSYPFPRAPKLKPNLSPSRLLNAAALLQVNARRIDGFIRSWR